MRREGARPSPTGGGKPLPYEDIPSGRGQALLLLVGLMVIAAACTRPATAPASDAPDPQSTRLRRDTDRDGFEELTAMYSTDGGLKRVAMDRNRDGRPELEGLYENGRLNQLVQEIESDTNGDGRGDRWERYENGRLVEILSDNDGDGRADQWEHFDSNGKLHTVQYDADGDGKPDNPPRP